MHSLPKFPNFTKFPNLPNFPTNSHNPLLAHFSPYRKKISSLVQTKLLISHPRVLCLHSFRM
jgi:hypothetical protein